MDVTFSFHLGYRPALDGVRAAAILLVLLAHAGFFLAPGGGVGVCLFFTLSGFLITSLLVQEHTGFGGIDLARFWGRRAVRLLPGLAGAFSATLLYSAVALHDEVLARQTIRAAPSVLLYVANWRTGLSGEGLGLFGPYWSLAVEEQFYLVWPIVIVAAMVLTRRRIGALVAVIGAAAVLTLANRYRLYGGVDEIHRIVRTDFIGDQLLLGCALGLAFHRWGSERFAAVARGLLPPALAFLAWSVVLVRPTEGDSTALEFFCTVGYTFVAISSVVLIAHLVTRPTGWLARASMSGAAVYLGRISYGLYLWHILIFTIVRERTDLPRPVAMALEMGLSVAVAALSFRFVEQPVAQRFRGRLARRGAGSPAADAGAAWARTDVHQPS